jgi:hypothetical protein
MKTNILKSFFAITSLAFIATSCVDDDYKTPTFDCIETTLVKNKEVADIPASAIVTRYAADDIIEAYVVSSDKEGNFFKSVSFQTLDGSKAFSVPMDIEATFATFDVGRKVLIKMQGLYTDISNGGMRIGGLFVTSSGTASVGRLTRTQVRAALFSSCTVKNESELVQNVSLVDLQNDIYINRLIELNNVQFTTAALDKTYYDANNDIGGATNHFLSDNLGSTIVFRTSSFAAFAGRPVQTGSGKVTGILTKFGDTYQFVARYESDIQLGAPRFDLLAPSFSENFEGIGNTGNNAFVNLPGWTNVSMNNALTTAERWEARIFSNNKYAQMSAFGTGESNLDIRLITPALTLSNGGGNFLKFGMKTSFFNGVALTVWYSTDYNGAGTVAAVNNATWTQLNTNVPSITDTSFATNFYSIFANLTPLAGQTVYISFRYQGSTTAPVVTTTYQVDNVQLLQQ